MKRLFARCPLSEARSKSSAPTSRPEIRRCTRLSRVALTKGEKMDFVVEKATELGAQPIVPFTSTFSVPKLDEEKIAARTARWREDRARARPNNAAGRGRRKFCRCATFETLVERRFGAMRSSCFSGRKNSGQSLRQTHEKARRGEIPASCRSVPKAASALRKRSWRRLMVSSWFISGRRILRAETAAVGGVELGAVSLGRFELTSLASPARFL